MEKIKSWLTGVLAKRLLVAALAALVTFLGDRELLDGALVDQVVQILSAW